MAFVGVSTWSTVIGGRGTKCVERRRRCTVSVVETPRVGSVKTQPLKNKNRGREPVLHTEGDKLQDEPWMIGSVLGAGLLSAAELVSVSAQAGSGFGLASALLGVFAGYLFADVGSGIYHWALDNYGSKDTPVFGYQIEAFQGHHASPWTITNRGLFNNISRPAIVGLPLFALMLIFQMPVAVEAFLWTTVTLSVLAQEFHKWSHIPRPSAPVRFLMDAGLLISTKVHGQHHRNPFEGNYCIVNGRCNEFLDRTKFFRKLEGLVYRLTGNAPICWDLDPSLKVEALGEATA
mmetsp:Transcript_30457/g.116684  ORF Transcript_30457/g.116684 Transcript_30457/m.116684 type:complete len:291 (-) Transcript_30457:593-1465(-)|eukprot:CAMPEP_0113956318 /NCGR_PEP_ID=MMETSP0011_2-20120614/1980_1 /TAXON_ID=101924 /ORGANISM="Rhodosorus marinus" /LENGTH=290 /DNA_ID=CAMNT_0000966421 /DNA_START=165 /DNA_END=1037 /DNA_ORIENTATION=+ /assembly_acc=CAM_ASM_000156